MSSHISSNMSENKPGILSILITDDDPRNRVYIAEMLKSITSTVQIDEAEDGETALRMVANRIKQTDHPYDLILMDYQMPGINGQQTTASIRKIEAETAGNKKSIIITWSTIKNTPYPGADDWLPKPPRVEDIRYLLSTYDLL